MSMMDKVMDYMTEKMSKVEKDEMMNRMMDKFLAGMTVEDKKNLMAEMMPKMMEGINMMEMMPNMMMGMMDGGNEGGMMGMMPKIGGDGKEMQIEMMPQMMMEMMPRCLGMMLPNIPKGKRIDFVSKMVATLIEQGSVGLSEAESREYLEKVTAAIKSKI